MTNLQFIINIIFFFNLFISSKSDICKSQFSDCFNCSVCGDESSDNCYCKWNSISNVCSNGHTGSSKDPYFFNYFDSCNDLSSIEIMEKYCGSPFLDIKDKKEIQINIHKNGRIYGTPNLFCKYTFTPFNYPDASFTIDYNTYPTNDWDNIYIFISLFYKDQKIHSFLNQKAITKTYDKIREFE
jgi:hypothetical protein